MRANKRYGQHFLQGAWADKLVTAIAPTPADRFLEIGPGPGALTLRLARNVSHLTAVEVDAQMVAELRPRLPGNVDLVQQDFLDFDLGPVAAAATRGLRIAGNLPYNAASPILIKLLAARRSGLRITDATLMVQREVADRIEGQPGTKAFGTLSIFVQLRADVRRLMTLPPGAFRPAPKVHSAVLRLEFREPQVSMLHEPTFEALVRAIFTQRRKTIANALRPFAEARGIDPRDAIARAALDGTRRPEALQITDLARLADVFSSQLS
jgi:16S rRNA (adenine1518-N6/adenine1519-N6)-dimethyltransferase